MSLQEEFTFVHYMSGLLLPLLILTTNFQFIYLKESTDILVNN